MASAAKKAFVTPEEYLARERLAAFKSEYHDGQVFPMGESPVGMAGTSRVHNLIAGNLARVFGNALVDRPCELYVADMRVGIREAGSYAYPDLAIVCGEPRFEDGAFDTLLNPTAIVEVLSPSTESWDRGGKFEAFRRLDSLRDYVLVSQNRVLVEHHARRGERWLLTEWRDLGDLLRLESIGAEVNLRDIYAKVPLADGEARPGN